MTTQDINQIVWAVVISAILIWIPIDATESIGRGVTVGLFAVFCFFGFKNAVINEYFEKSKGERNKAVIIFYIIYAVIFYSVMKYAYLMTHLNHQCYENDNQRACNELEYRQDMGN